MKEGLAVFVVQKDGLTRISARGNVVQRAWEFEA